MSQQWNLKNFIPVDDIDDLLELEPDEIAEFVLRFVAAKPSEGVGALTAYTFGLHYSRDWAPLDRQNEVALALAEAWAWLVRECLLIPDLGDMNKGFVLSRRGWRLIESGDFSEFRAERSLQRDQIHARLRKQAYSDFIRGDYDGATFKAMREVEIAVRGAGGYPESLYGLDLIGEAFHIERGKLTDKNAVTAEQKAVSALFAGAIGLLKNPGSHHSANPDAATAAEIIYLASYLLRIVDERSAAREAGE
jgi:uncharacterized protein (TIGR02391 family)